MPETPLHPPAPLAVPRAAYLHVPFCRHRCGYCNFTLVAGRDDLIEAWLTAVEQELAGLGARQELDTLSLGGGTPSHLNGAQLRRLFGVLRQWFELASDAEVSVEANPADCQPEKLDLLAELGVTRLSLGAQSFDPSKLRQLERDHTPEQIRTVAKQASQRFASWSLDLIFAAPGETLAAWQRDVSQALELQPPHISAYGLTVERGTSFFARQRRGELPGVGEEVEATMYEHTLDTLTAAGYEHYEVSNYARSGHRSRHNQVYWRGEGYFAFGPGAARYVAGRREVNHRSTTTYIRRLQAGQSPVAESEALAPADRARERLVFGLRMREGISRQEFQTATGFSLESLVGQPLRTYLAQGWLEEAGDRVRLTRAGLLISDALWPAFLTPTRSAEATGGPSGSPLPG